MSLIKFYSLQENMVLVSKPVFVSFNQSPNKNQCFSIIVEKLADLRNGYSSIGGFTREHFASRDRNNSCLNE